MGRQNDNDKRAWEPINGSDQILITLNQLTFRFKLEKQMKVEIAIPYSSLPRTNVECPTVACPVLRGLKHCLDEIDNTIKPVLVWMHHYDPLLHQPLQMEHTILALGPFGGKKYNYKMVAGKCVLFRMGRQACTSSDMCWLPAYLTAVLRPSFLHLYWNEELTEA